MYRIVYTSTARPGTTPDEVADIVEQAEALNSRKRITGALAFDGARFCQLLEGEKGVIETLFARITRDARHHDVVAVGSADVTERCFPGWSMLLVEQEELADIIEALAD